MYYMSQPGDRLDHATGAVRSPWSRTSSAIPERAVGIDQKSAMSLGGALGAPATAFQYD